MKLESAMDRLAEAHSLSPEVSTRLLRLVEALASERDPPTTIRVPDDVLHRHLADSLAGLAMPAVSGAGRLADIGAGAGFPGLPLAVALPDTRVDLIEASRRKCQVIERLARAAEAVNATAVPARVESWGASPGGETYDAATARAVASLAVLAEYGAPLLRIGGSLVAWKGARDTAEEDAVGAAAERLGLEYVEVVPVDPFPDARDRHLHRFVKRHPTPPEFPRRPGQAAKRPLA